MNTYRQIIHPPLTNTSSASPLPIPNEMMKSPREVGKGIAKNIDKNTFIICHNFSQKIQTKLVYLFSIQFGKLFSRLTAEYKKDSIST